MESTLILPRVTKAAESLESRAQGEGSNPSPSSGESDANLPGALYLRLLRSGRARQPSYSGALEMLNPQMKSWGLYELMRRQVQQLEQQGEPEPRKTHWAPGSVEW